MLKRYLTALLAAMCLATLDLNACGSSNAGSSNSSSGSGSEVVARVGNDPITRSAVNHWMGTLAGGDYYQLSHKYTVPSGLATDPPNFAACVTTLQAAAAHAPAKIAATPTGPELLRKCRELYEGLKRQAISYLINAQWQTNLDREQGVTASNAEVMQLFDTVKAREFPTEADQQTFFAKRHLTLADELFILKLDLLGQKVLTKLTTTHNKQIAAGFEQASTRWTAKTTCNPGYIVEHCNTYKGETTAIPPTSVLIEQVAALTQGFCINKPACAKQ